MKNLGTLVEVQLPADELERTVSYYRQMGFEVASRQPWGMVQLKEGSGATLTLFPREFWPETALAFESPDLLALKRELADQGIPLEEDSVDLEPPRLSFRDPSGNLIYTYQGWVQK
ncbi:MAG TPA: VOC family protein [Anaerolineales bacterium]|nr:VOC family protein [Anaerolineales bacterium]